jgi:3-phenylpropionate/trans-cinnamate dioxygenase ferredoxin reductase subunit
MADRRVEHLLIGGGIASASCAAELRAAGATGSILLVGRELDPPYHRPPGSKGYLLGRETREDTYLEVPDDVEVLTRTSVMALDTEARTAKLSTKEEVEYGTALIATGAMVRRLQADGSDLEGIHYLRALGNADAIRRDAEEASRVVCVGGSYIGCEVAASLTVLGRRCTIVMLEDEPMERGFGTLVGRHVRSLLEGHGIEVVGGAAVDRFAGEGRVGAVVLADGREIPADVVVCGTGAIPDVMLARRAGLEIGAFGGVVCDETLRTSAEGLYAAGDICEHVSVVHGRTVRIEHEEVAASQGRTAARNMLGAGEPHREVPYFWTDLADWASMEYVGPAETWDTEEVRGDVGSGAFAVWYLHQGRVVAALSAGGHGDLDAARELIARREPVDVASLP